MRNSEDSEDSQILFLKEIIEQGKTYENIEVYTEIAGSVVNMADIYSSVLGIPVVFKISSLESDFILTMTFLLPMERYAQFDRDDLYAYGNIATEMFCLTECEYIEDGLYENQTVYILYDSEGGIQKSIVTTIKVNGADGYVKPHISLCKDTMKINYNVDGNTFVCVPEWSYGYQYLSIYDSNGNVLLSLTRSVPSGYLYIPSDGTLIIDYSDFIQVDGIERGADIQDYEDNKYTYYNVPLNAREIMLGFAS